MALSLLSTQSSFAGSTTYVITDNSMRPTLLVGDVVSVDKDYPFANLHVGDIIAINQPEGTNRIVVHRIAEINRDPTTLRTKGDANPSSIPGIDYPITIREYIGKVAEARHSNQEPIMLQATSTGSRSQQHYYAEINWTPQEIGQPNIFHVIIFDSQNMGHSPLSASYNFKIYKGEESMTAITNSTESDTSQDFAFVFANGGSYNLTITNIERTDERITIPIQVTPEFSASPFTAVILGPFIFAVIVVGLRILPKNSFCRD